MSGSVKQDKARGTWLYVVDATGRDGKRRQIRKRGFPTKRAAQTALDQLRRDMRGGRGVDPNRMTYGDFLEQRWLPHIEALPEETLKDTTKAGYRNAARHLIRHAGHIVTSELRGDDLDAVYAKIPRQSAWLRHKVHVVASKSLGDAVRWRYVAFNAADDATPPPQPRPKPEAWGPADVGRFLEQAKGDRWFALFRLAACSGMRRGEVAGLRWSDIDFERSEVTIVRNAVTVDGAVVVTTPKSGRHRTLSLDPDTLAALRAHRRRQAEEYLVLGQYRPDGDDVWTWQDGSRLHPAVITRTFKRLAEAADLPPLRLHSLRHAWASNALDAGVELLDVSQRLGHASIGFTAAVYVTPSTQRDAAAARTVAALYDRPRAQ